MLNIPESKLSYSDPDRIWGAIKSIAPAAGYMVGGDMAYSGSMPIDEKWKRINLWLRRLGQPGFKRRDVEMDKYYEEQNENRRNSSERRALQGAGREE